NGEKRSWPLPQTNQRRTASPTGAQPRSNGNSNESHRWPLPNANQPQSGRGATRRAFSER
ncbi:MAG TPA: hypothetical protein VIV60_11995, partial [Polyangiaceae bacterium]